MSSIDKLMITGVRSFNVQRGETIKFEPPLTLVVGYNGSGKTTIIECLKYATTGILPPGSKMGGAFIHDPGLEGEREVLAQVKMSFKSANGHRMVATRNLQLTVKKASRSQKTLEASLLMDRDGQRTTISSRVAELDAILPNYLGVSSAVLENVIFCHQDDSLWPLAESSTLKKKFDEIFEAAKYTRAVDELRKIRKKHKDELGKLQILEAEAKKDRDRARKVQIKSEELQADVEALREQANNLEQKMRHAQELAASAWKESESFSRILGTLDGKRIEANGKQNTIRDLRVHLKEINESDEWLEDALSHFDATMTRYRESRDVKNDQTEDLRQEFKSTQSQLQNLLAEKGKYEQEKEDHERQLERRRARIREAASKHSIHGFDDLSRENTVEDFLFKIRKLAKDKKSASDRIRREGENEKQEALSLTNRLTERKAALQDVKLTAKRQTAVTERDKSEYQSRVDQFNVNEGDRAVMEAKIDETNTKLEKAKKAFTSADYDTKIRISRARLHELEERHSGLNNELVQGTKRASEIAKLAHMKQERKDKERSLKTLMSAHGERITSLIGSEWEPATLESSYQRAFDDALHEMQAVERDRDAVARELEQVQFRHKLASDDLGSKHKLANEYEQTIKDTIEGDVDDYEEELNSAQLRVESMRDEAKGLGGLTDWWTKCLDVANDRHACRLCERSFKGPEDPKLAKFKQKLDGLIRKAGVEVAENELQRVEAEYKQLVDLPYQKLKQLKSKEISSLTEDLKGLNQQRESLLSKIELAEKKVEERQAGKKELETISKTTSSIFRTHGEIESLSEKIDDIMRTQDQTGMSRTPDDIQEDIVSATEQIREKQKNLTQLATDQDTAKSEIHTMELGVLDIRGKRDTIVSQLDKQASLVARVEEFKAQIQKQRESVEKTDRDIEKLEPELATAQARYDDLVLRWDLRLQELGKESSSLSDTVNGLELLNDDIRGYVDRGGGDRLANTSKNIAHSRQQMERVEGSLKQLDRDLRKLEDDIRDGENTERQYADNLRYRKETRELQKLRGEIEELESHNAHMDRDRLQRDSQKREAEFHAHSSRREGVVAEMRTKDVQLGELLKEYETDLHDAGLRYKESHIKVETTKAAVEDIGRYSNALDRAIMKYHTLKMDEVNTIIDELWKRTYQGTDIDTIYIKSDLEVKTTTRSHNYRVVMIKKDVELDMRGRCSAGQKVLASIIIRLALAECFSTNCGVIALDEPTTNLDQDNIQALAESLHGIIQAREQQRNFQLIVITHDEEFLRAMKCGDFTDSYYRVSRDVDQNSIIERQNINAVL